MSVKAGQAHGWTCGLDGASWRRPHSSLSWLRLVCTGIALGLDPAKSQRDATARCSGSSPTFTWSSGRRHCTAFDWHSSPHYIDTHSGPPGSSGVGVLLGGLVTVAARSSPKTVPLPETSPLRVQGVLDVLRHHTCAPGRIRTRDPLLRRHRLWVEGSRLLSLYAPFSCCDDRVGSLSVVQSLPLLAPCLAPQIRQAGSQAR
jgi:hypothetical protein